MDPQFHIFTRPAISAKQKRRCADGVRQNRVIEFDASLGAYCVWQRKIETFSECAIVQAIAYINVCVVRLFSYVTARSQGIEILATNKHTRAGFHKANEAILDARCVVLNQRTVGIHPASIHFHLGCSMQSRRSLMSRVFVVVAED